MPILEINTNMSRSIIPLNFEIKTCEIMAEIFKSPLKVK